MLRLEDERRLDTAVLGRLLEDPNEEIRRRAALALGRIKDRQAVSLLMRALRDSSVLVRRDASFALGVLGDTSATITAALAGRARADVPEVAIEAVAALGKLPTETSFEAVLEILESVRDTSVAAPIGVVNEALLAVWKLPRPERAFPAVAPLVWPAEVETRWRATYAVMRIGTPASVPVLLPALADENPQVRALAVRGLRGPLADSAEASGTVRAALLTALSDRHPHVRINAATALGTHGHAAVADSVSALLADTDDNVRVAATQALARLGNASSALVLLDLASDTSTATGVRAAALSALGRIAPALAARAAMEWASSSRWLLRLHAVRALGALEWSVAGAGLGALSRDSQAVVAIAALNAVSRLRDTSAAARALLLEGMRRQETDIRAAAIRGLARRAGAEDLAPLLEAYERAQGDSGNAAALAAIDGLGAIRNAGAPVDNLFFARFAPADDPDVRRRVVQRLGGDWEVPEETPPEPRPNSFYRAAVERYVAPGYRREAAPRLLIRMARGDIVVELAPAEAPLTVRNIVELVESGYYASDEDVDRRRWHRVVPNFVLQDGAPRADGGGGPGYTIRDEINRMRYERGMLGMALAGPDTGGGQFFITHAPQPHLDGGYTIFGRVVEGMDVADLVVQDEPILDMRVIWP